MRPELLDLAHHDLALENPEPRDAIHLLHAEGDELDQLVGREVEVHVLAEPA
jgi:hypothetical protein